MKRYQAITLVEIMVALILLSLAVFIGSNFLYHAYQHHQVYMSEQVVEEELRYALNRLSHEIQHADDVQAPTGYRTNVHEQRAITTVCSDANSRLVKQYKTWYVGENLQQDSINIFKLKDQFQLFCSPNKHAKGGQPVAQYMNAAYGYSGKEPGLKFSFYDENGLACTLRDNVCYVDVALTYTFTDEETLRVHEYVPIQAKRGGAK